jgi:hypothetical protein
MQSVEIKSEQRGSHWVAWPASTPTGVPYPILIVGQTQDEAESRLRAWLEEQHATA